MNLKVQEQILIKDIFAVSVKQDDNSVFQLRVFPKDIAQLGESISLLNNLTCFDSLLMERLQSEGTDVLAYLEDCLGRCHQALDKPWNSGSDSQQFINYSLEIIHNFISLSMHEPDLFPDQLQIDSEATKTDNTLLSIAMKYLTHSERRGFNHDIFTFLHCKLEPHQQHLFISFFIDVLLARQRFQTILQPKAFFYLGLLAELLDLPFFKEVFFSIKNTPFIPAELNKLQGANMDNRSPFGLFSRLSILGVNAQLDFYQQMEVYKKFEQRLLIQLGKGRLSKEKLRLYSNLQTEYQNKLTQVYKILLKKESKNKFLQWHYALIISNKKKIQLASRLVEANMSTLSHDGHLLNVYVALLNLCRIILRREQHKYQSIDPQYFSHNDRMRHVKYPLLNTRHEKANEQKQIMEKQFGTITQFFFLSLQFMNVGLIPALENFVELVQRKQKIEKYKQKLAQFHPMMQKIVAQIEMMQCRIMRYFIVLFDEQMMVATIKLFDMVMFLLPKWLGLEYENLCDADIKEYCPSDLVYTLPQFLLQSIHKYHLINFKFKQDYILVMGTDHLHSLVRLTCLLLSKVEIISNPYLPGSFVELLFYLLQETKTRLLNEVFQREVVAHRNLTYGLICFYCDIAVTGSSHQFYAKFKYRFYINKIFTSLWIFEVYRQNLRSYFHQPVFERFLNMVMTDTTYCFDESNEYYEKYKALEDKKLHGPLSPEDHKNQEQISTIISSTLSQSTSNLRLIQRLSEWSPDTFLAEAELTTVVPLLNSVLKTLIDPTAFSANRHLVAKYKFQPSVVLSDLLQIYGNLDINERISNQIVKDTRNYKKQYFSKALQKASNQYYTSIDVLQKFEGLIGKLLTAINEEEADEIYGEIPEKYLCALMNTFMKDPVLLPSSGNIVDRVNIQRSLLIDERDPFTRAPLTQTAVKEMKELQKEIQAWKQKRLQQLKQGGKEIKYGNIAAIKKQTKDTHQGEDFAARRINYPQDD